MNLFSWLLFGFIAGVLANVIDPRPASGGIFGAIILGILGAMVGGFVSNVLFGLEVSGFNIQSFAIAVAGSLLLLLLQRAFTRRI
jgi:uncharacterized membrane protein YeaQ/YmgE (transglycosylase-associated protein family)